METQVPRELPVIAGHLALDFANTVDDPDGAARHDHIATWPGLLAWSVRAGVLAPAAAERLGRLRAREAAAGLEHAHALRDVLNETFADPAHAAGHWAALKPYAIDALTHSELTPGPAAYALSWPDDGPPQAMLRPVAHAAMALLTGPELHRVKQCAGCPWLFLDRSKNGSRRWCAMGDCGTHQKITRYVARRAARRGATG
jgi:predicted RNA-binding Zn ribbon-like protein